MSEKIPTQIDEKSFLIYWKMKLNTYRDTMVLNLVEWNLDYVVAPLCPLRLGSSLIPLRWIKDTKYHTSNIIDYFEKNFKWKNISLSYLISDKKFENYTSLLQHLISYQCWLVEPHEGYDGWYSEYTPWYYSWHLIINNHNIYEYLVWATDIEWKRTGDYPEGNTKNENKYLYMFIKVLD